MDQLIIINNIEKILKKINSLAKRLNLYCIITLTDDLDNIIRKLKRGKYINDITQDTFGRKVCYITNNKHNNHKLSKINYNEKQSCINRKIVTLQWDLLMTDVLKCISNESDVVYPNQILNLIETERKSFQAQADVLLRNERIRSFENRNYEPIYKGTWRKEAYPQRVYEPLSSYTITDTISDKEKSNINLFTNLSDGYLGVPYNYDDHQLTEEWITAFKDKKGKRDVKASEDSRINIQVQKLVESLVDKVYDKFCTESNVLENGPIELGPYLKEVPVWGIDCYTRRMIELSIADAVDPPELYNDEHVREFIERRINCAINAQPVDKAHNLTNALNYLLLNDGLNLSSKELAYTKAVLKVINEIGISDNFRIHPKGTGVICTKDDGIAPEEFVCEYLGELYPPYRWCERIDVIKQAQEKYSLKPSLPDFYNILLERPRQDPEGYGILFVDASMKSNVGSTINHSCNPNCSSSIVSRNGKLSIALTSKRRIFYGEEITHDYHCITNSEVEWAAAICLCGMSDCRGSFLYYAAEEDLQQILEKNCGPLWRFAALLRSCSEQPLTPSDKEILDRHGMKSAALSKNPATWIKKFVAYNLRFVEFERQALPMKLLRPKEGKDSDYDYETADQVARNVMEQRLQSLTCCFSMVNRVFDIQKDKVTTEPLRTLTVSEAVDEVWKTLKVLPKLLKKYLISEAIKELKVIKKGSKKVSPEKLINEQIEYIERIINDKPKSTIGNMRNAILDIRDSILVIKEFENPKARLTLLCDILVLWAFTNNFSTPREMIPIESESLVVFAREVGSNIPRELLTAKGNDKNTKNKKTETLSPNEPIFTGKKTYDKNFVLSQLLNWINAGTEVYSSPELLGCCQIPPPSSCFGISESLYTDEARKYLQYHLNDDRAQMAPWTSILTKCFTGDINSLNIYGSPYLDQALGQVDNINNAISLIGGRKHNNKVAKIDIDGPQFDKLLPPECANSWVQCESCRKWRRVPWNVDPEKLPELWECSLNYWDLDKASCDSPIDDFDADRETTIDTQNLEKVNEDDLQVGSTFDVLCLELLVYFEATIIAVKNKLNGGKKLKFHFLGWENAFDEWIDSNSERIQPHHLYTEVLEKGITVKYKTAPEKNATTKNNNKKKTTSRRNNFDTQVYDYSKQYNNSSSRRSKEIEMTTENT